ncbi:MAG TPA: hypothetical protein VF186_10035 [Gaiellaceae bacterium]
MRPLRLALAALLAVAAVAAALAAHDVLAWRAALHHGDRVPEVRSWLPGDPVPSALGLHDDVRLRRAVRAFDAAISTSRGFDAGETRDRVRSAAEVKLSNVAAGRDAAAASQAGDLLGVLVAQGGTVTGGVTADERAQDAFDAAIRRDFANADAKYNLELLLRRTKATSTRHGAGTGSGTRGRGNRGAGAGAPGRGY